MIYHKAEGEAVRTGINILWDEASYGVIIEMPKMFGHMYALRYRYSRMRKRTHIGWYDNLRLVWGNT